MRVGFIFALALCALLSVFWLNRDEDGRLAESPRGEESQKSPRLPDTLTLQQAAGARIPFIENQGQVGGDINFYAETLAGGVFVKSGGEITYSIPSDSDSAFTLSERLLQGNSTAPTGREETKASISEFIGNDPSKWKTAVPAYGEVSFGEIYDGIELRLKAYGGRVEKLFYIKPGADPSQIKIAVEGARVSVNPSGELEAASDGGVAKFSKPLAYQEIGGEIKFAEADYLAEGGEYGFLVKNYDPSQTLVIDPILSATFLGGSKSDDIFAVATDPSGNVYVAGITQSKKLPGVNSGSADSVMESAEAFVMKFDAKLSVVLGATFIGGSGVDAAVDIALDRAGNVYLGGRTDSPDFPGIDENSPDRQLSSAEGFLVKLDSKLTKILASTYIGGSGADGVVDIALDKPGNVYAVGSTTSTDFPGISRSSPDRFPLKTEGFVIKLSPSLSKIVAATYLGGSAEDGATAIAFDRNGNVYVAGSTSSSDFPEVNSKSLDQTLAISEAFVAKLTPNLSKLVAATYLGGVGRGAASAIAVDGNGRVYVAGVTNSSDFPGVGATSADSVLGGNQEGFIAAMNSNLTYPILASTFLGGEKDDLVYEIILDGKGGIYAAGRTGSAQFPASPKDEPRPQVFFADAFISKLNSDLSSVLSSTFIPAGGLVNLQSGISAAISGRGDIYIAGVTGVSEFKTQDSFFASEAVGGGNDGFIAQIGPAAEKKLLEVARKSEPAEKTPPPAPISAPEPASEPAPGEIAKATPAPPAVEISQAPRTAQTITPAPQIKTEAIATPSPQINTMETPAPITKEKTFYEFGYTAKITCGIQGDTNNINLARGFYGASVAVYNPNPSEAKVSKKLVFTHPQSRAAALGEISLKPGAAVTLDCSEIRDKLFGGKFPKPYHIDALAVIESDGSLDVEATYTAAALDFQGLPKGVGAIEVRRIQERRRELPSRAAAKSPLPDLILLPGVDGSFCHRDGNRLTVTVKNQGAYEAAASKTKVNFQRYGRFTVTAPPLAPGASADGVVEIPRRCLRNRNCAFSLTADSASTVAEADERNNSAQGVCIGR
ncbi:MAG: DUF7948 domain-containing protein [Deltaproteobacteria bacterium]